MDWRKYASIAPSEKSRGIEQKKELASRDNLGAERLNTTSQTPELLDYHDATNLTINFFCTLSKASCARGIAHSGKWLIAESEGRAGDILPRFDNGRTIS